MMSTERANYFRSSPLSRHSKLLSACLKRANNGHTNAQKKRRPESGSQSKTDCRILRPITGTQSSAAMRDSAAGQCDDAEQRD